MQRKTSDYVAMIVAAVFGLFALSLIAVNYQKWVLRNGPPAELCQNMKTTSQSLESDGKIRFEGGGRVSIMPVAWQTLPKSARDGLLKIAAVRVACVHRTEPQDVVVTVSSMIDGQEFYSDVPPF